MNNTDFKIIGTVLFVLGIWSVLFAIFLIPSRPEATLFFFLFFGGLILGTAGMYSLLRTKNTQK